MFYKINKPTYGSKQILELRRKLKLEDCNYYVYIHYKYIDNVLKPIYVGKGTFLNSRPTDNKQRCWGTDKDRAYNVKDFIDIVEIVDFYYDENLALEIEEELTDILKEKATWTIYNKFSGNKWNETSRKKLSESKTNPSMETRRRMSKGCKKSWTKERKQKHIEKLVKPCVSELNGEVIKHNSIEECASYFNVSVTFIQTIIHSKTPYDKTRVKRFRKFLGLTIKVID